VGGVGGSEAARGEGGDLSERLAWRKSCGRHDVCVTAAGNDGELNGSSQLWLIGIIHGLPSAAVYEDFDACGQI